MAKIIAASILSADFSKLGDEMRSAEKAGADWIHFDVMDGRFVPNISFGIPVLESIRPCSTMIFDAHLMIQNPEKYVRAFKKAGADFITVHAEASTDLADCVSEIKKAGAKAGVSVKPKTPLDKIIPLLPELDLLLIMGVEPGFGGQSFDTTVLKKIAQARKLIDEAKGRTIIEVDGGVNEKTAEEISKAGADAFVTGSYLFKHPKGLQSAIAELRKKI